jgi:hypothetical protein
VRLVPVIVLVGLTAACGGAVSVHNEAATAGRVPMPVARPDLPEGLLTAAQLRPIAGRFVRASLAADTPNPDPRAACGAKLALPSLQRGASVKLESRAGLELFEWIGRLPAGHAAAFIAAEAADEHPGCPSYLTATPYGHPQQNAFLGGVRLPAVGDERMSFSLRIREPGSGDDRPVYATAIAVREGDLLALVTIAGLRPQPDGRVRALAVRAAADLRRAVPAGSAA